MRCALDQRRDRLRCTARPVGANRQVRSRRPKSISERVSKLRRTRAGPFSLEQAISLDFLSEAAKARQFDGAVLPLTAALDDIPALPVTPDQAQLLRHGQTLIGFPATPGLQLATDDNRPVALVEAAADGLRVVRGFNL